MVICFERGADLHMAQLMPLPLTVSCFSKIQIGFTFLVPAHPRSFGQRAVKQVCVCVVPVAKRFRAHNLTADARFYRAMLCIRGTSRGPVSVRPFVCPSVHLNEYVVSIAPFSTTACPDCSQNIT